MKIKQIIYLFLFYVISAYSGDNTINVPIYYQTADTLSSAKSVEFNSSLAPLRKFNFGYINSAIWTKFVLKNSSHDRQELVVFNPRPGTNHFDTYIFQNGKLIKLTS